MSEHEPGDAIEWLLENWTARLADSLEGMLGERPNVVWRASEGPAPTSEDMLWWEQPLSLGPGVVLFAGAPQAAWNQVGGQILRGAGIEVSDPHDARNTYLEVLSQTCSGLATAIGKHLSTEVTCENGKEAAAPPPEAAAFEIELTLAGAQLPVLHLSLPSAWREALRTDVARPAATALVEHSEPHDEPPPAKPAPNKASKTFDLLMEVELPVSVSFGRAQLPLKDVLKLTTGSIVELNRTISEPVEVIVNNCVIARGEVVVVEGNYGVRIQEIISREKRLRTLQ